jgi:tetratricopeptide (TPR) repeat protein
MRPPPDYSKMAWQNPLDVAERVMPKQPSNPNYVLYRMELARTALRVGAHNRAKPLLLAVRNEFERKAENIPAAISSERLKYYKGETYERAMACCYLGYMEYMGGDYNNARICFANARSEDQKAVVHQSTPKEFGEDFGLASYWLGRTYLKLNRMDLSRIALGQLLQKIPRKTAEGELAQDKREAKQYQTRRAEGEKWAFQTFHNPKKQATYMGNIQDLAAVQGAADSAPKTLGSALPASPVLQSCGGPGEFFTPEYQKDTNLVLTIEVGRCPWKRLAGLYGEHASIARSLVRPALVNVYVDGHLAGRAFPVVDLWVQADTQDRIVEKDIAQGFKAGLKFVLECIPYVGDVAKYWDVSGDARHWASLPGRIFVYAGKLTPGPHTIRLEMFDVNGQLLPRWRNTYHGIAVPKDGEACVLLDPCFDADNQLADAQRQKAVSAGAKPQFQDMSGIVR